VKRDKNGNEECPNCGHFMHKDWDYCPCCGQCRELTRQDIENLLTKASQPLAEQGQKPDSLPEKTSESQTSGDCNGKNTR
jgi:hypothetical protein